MPSLLDLLKKGGNAVKDAFTYSEEEQASGKKPSVLERIPMRVADTRDNIGSFFAPAPDKVRTRDVVRELPGATGTVLKDILQGTARSFDFVGRQIQDPVGRAMGIDTELDKTTSTKMEDILFGGRAKRSDTLSDVGETELGIDQEKNPILAPLAGLGIIGLDFVPGGQGKGKGLFKLGEQFTDDVVDALSKTRNTNTIKNVITESVKDVPDDVIAKLSDDIARSTSPAKVREAIQNTENALNGKPRNVYSSQAEADGWVKKYGDQIAERQSELARLRSEAVPQGTRTRKVQSDINYLRANQRKAELDSLGFRNMAKEKAPVARETGKRGGDAIIDPTTNQLKDPAVGMTFYHGTTPENKASILRDGIDTGKNTKGFAEQPNAFYIASKEEAMMYGKENDLVGIRPIADIKTLDVSSQEWADTLGRSTSAEETGRILQELRERGYDAVNHGDEIEIINPSKFEAVDIVEQSKKMIVDEIPETNKKQVAKALDSAETETKKLSPRRLQDAKKYGISEDVMGRMLHAKAGGRLTHAEASNLADTINAPMRDLLEKDARTFQLSRPKIEAYSQELQGYFEQVVKKLKANAEAFPKDRDLAEQYQTASRTYMKARTTLEAVISEAGRVVEGSKVIGKYSRLPGMDGKIKVVRDQIVKFAERNPKHADLPTEFDMALETVDLNNTTQMLDFLTQWNRASFLQKLSEFQKASLLSALSTHAVNALGNAISQVLNVPVRAVAGVLDAGKSAVTGSKRTVYAGESLAQVRGGFRSAPASIERAVKALGNEHYAQELRRTEIEAGTVVPAIRGRFGKVVRLPFRLLQSADLAFRTVNKGAESEALATRIARTEGLKGKEFKARVDELKDNLPQDMIDLVDERVERSLMLEELDGLLKSVEDLKNKYPALQFVIPFYRTLVNLSREAYRMTPIGGIGRTVGRITPGQTGRNIERAFHNKWTQNEATKMEELSRQIVGTSIMAWVVSNMLNGDIEITGPAPSSAGDREVFYGQGKLPHSIRYGDTWVEFQRVQPIGQLLQIGSSISEAIDAYKNTGQLNSKEVEEEMLGSISDIGSMVFTQSPFTGAADLFALLSGGEYNEGYFQAGNRYVGQLAGTFIPNILRRLTVAQDPIVYEKRDITSQLKSRVPGLQDDLTPRRDLFGETIRQGGTFTSRFASPIRTNESIENRLYDEMAELEFTPTVPNRRAFNEELSVKEYDTLKLFYGPRFRDEMWQIVNDPSYKTLTPEQKRDVLSSTSRKVMDMARQTLFPVYIEKDQLRKQWQAEGYTPMVIEDALNAQFPYDKDTLEIYADTLLDQSIQQGDARKTIEDLLQ